MKLFKTKIWSWLDIVLLKWGVLLIGMVAGALLPDFIISHVWMILLAAFIVLIKPSIDYFKD
jgi:hypothetical protein